MGWEPGRSAPKSVLSLERLRNPGTRLLTCHLISSAHTSVPTLPLLPRSRSCLSFHLPLCSHLPQLAPSSFLCPLPLVFLTALPWFLRRLFLLHSHAGLRSARPPSWILLPPAPGLLLKCLAE